MARRDDPDGDGEQEGESDGKGRQEDGIWRALRDHLGDGLERMEGVSEVEVGHPPDPTDVLNVKRPIQTEIAA